ncbi:class II fructose-bisphosphate aldolase [Streptomyces sp. AV19]|uniref:class II fructose-bisphosphate aldolase n=1 Tax=Streptomyces sp. AV19 TaxID=2793068 RepID=UPI0018FE81EB|nr:class II fructose-bisphosphate aldolase [Streptomyces sp. AV19]MBH1936094.1 class II fructose-bisphosphate aldolase [Streptomyces sp. AV19]MDG4534111.1 class II fructose-bisphosphate aldolase family protein [Streptomyces sp. AV19]
MPLTRTADLLANGSPPVAAFNVITVEHAEAIAAGAEAAGRPAILQLSENAVKFHGGRLAPIASAASAVARASSAPLALHLDHVESADLLHAASAHDFSSVMYDASKLPYAENVKATAEAARWAHARGLWLEAELGRVGGKPGDAHTPGVRTDPAEAEAYVADTGVDALAVAVGSTHAMTSRTAALDHTLIATLRAAVPVPLVLHGSSGVPDDELRRAVASGIAKINVGTALNTAYTGAIRAFLEAHPSTVDPRRYLAPAREAMAATVERILRVIG